MTRSRTAAMEGQVTRVLAAGLLAVTLATILGLLAGCAGGGARTAPSPSESGSAAQRNTGLLQAQTRALELALLRQLERTQALQARLAAADLAERAPATSPAARLLRRYPGIGRTVESYFDALVFAATPGGAESIRERLAECVLPGAPLARARYLAAGLQAASAISKLPSDWVPAGSDPSSTATGGSPAAMQGALAVIDDLRIAPAGTSAVATVYPLLIDSVSVDQAGRVHAEAGGGEMALAGVVVPATWPHRLVLRRTGGRWLVRDDFSLDAAVPRLLQRGGAPPAVWRTARRRLAASLSRVYPVPPGVSATFERLFRLLNERRFAETAPLYARGASAGHFTARAFQHPYGSWRLALRWVHAYNPLRPEAVADAGRRLHVEVSADAPEDLFIAGGGGFPGFWEVQRSPSGMWQLVGGGTGR